MIRFVLGVFFILHGLVHLLYFGQSSRFFELQPNMIWPDGSWAFSSFLGVLGTRNFASILLVLAALGFGAGGIGLFTHQAWWRPVIIGTSVFSVVIFVLLWDGVMQMLDNKGGVGVLINLVILAALLVFQWPDLE